MLRPPPKTNRFVTGMTGHLVAGLIRTVRLTSSTVYDPPDFFDRLRSQVPFIMAMWHGQFMMLPDLNTREYTVEAMVARHGDADLVAHVLSQFGISAIRGAGAGGRRRDHGGAYALRAALKALDNGSIVAMTADIPPKRPRTAGDGIVTLARLSGRPIVPVAAATSRFFLLNNWSKMTVNLPLSRLAWVAGDPIFVNADDNPVAAEQARVEVERSLNAVTARAYELANANKRQPRTEAKADDSERQPY